MTRIAALPLLALALLAPFAAAGEGDADCLVCHSDKAALAELLGEGDPRVDELWIDGERHGRSVHGVMSCTDCHFDYEGFPHPEDGGGMSCVDCHDGAAETLSKSVHATAMAGEPVSCSACHGSHGILRPTERESRLFPLNVYKVCGECHFDVDPDVATREQLLAEPYTDDAHAHGLIEAGLAVSATCVSCHGAHDIHANGDPASPLHRTRVDVMCGECHVGVLEQYRSSVHHLKSDGPEHSGATCTDCHKPHEITGEGADFRAATVATCSNCHEERGGSFRLSYHGKRSLVGFQNDVALCSDCHGHHAIQPSDSPTSMIHEANLVQTCGQCHEKAHPEFTKYQVHVDPRRPTPDRPEIHMAWLLMNGLFLGVLSLGVLHALLWLVRALIAGDWRRHKKTGQERHYRRWRPLYVFLHIVLMTTVLMLAATGLPLHFADQPWAVDLMNWFGGAAAAGYVHRVFAVVLVAMGPLFLVHILWRAVAKREKGLFWGPNSMVPRFKDFQDLVGNLKWFVGLGERPKYDRWTYWEKFDFWAVAWGTIVIGLSGLMLWFPEEATRFVPGWFLNLAVIIHGIEALLDIAFIFTVHIFHANLRPDKFPMDPMFYTGRLDEHEFRTERPLEYERALRDGTLEAMVARTPRPRTRVIAYVIGTLAMGIGFFFLVAMVIALLVH